ncbi:MAG TPA: P1 family peptidase [Thermoanaerobaculia bacterium]|nr:P1 family peptidase [Thermoanaerobaculia bacterium]
MLANAANAAGLSGGLTDVAGLEVGHHTLTERPTGCTVILARGGAVAGVDVRGGAPGTRETDLLDPVNTVQEVHAIVLSGGSSFGLDTASGVMRYLDEHGIGFETRAGVVPIVPAAILFDLPVGDRPEIRPGPECGYAAAKAASSGPVAEGNVGAGAGATIGKLGGPNGAMKAGIGTASIRLETGLVVAALVAVNAVGDVIDPATGKVVAGARGPDGRTLLDARTLIRAGGPPAPAPRSGENTTIGVVATNAKLTQVQAKKMAMMAHDGLARAISPAHLPSDGDAVFAMATGAWEGEADVGILGALAAEALADAIVRAARQATGIPGYPAARDLSSPER